MILLLAASALAQLETTLAAQDSATAALAQICTAHHWQGPVTATPEKGEDALPPPDLDETLGSQGPKYRHVRLSCGGHILSEAHNWFAPEALTPAMAQTLATSDTPFGKVVAPLGFTRHRLTAKHGPIPGCPKPTVLSHRALLRLPDGRPLALVLECYQPASLGQ